MRRDAAGATRGFAVVSASAGFFSASLTTATMIGVIAAPRIAPPCQILCTTIAAVSDAALAANEDAAEKIRGGNMKAIGPIIGHVMRETKGRADGGEVTRLVREKLGV